MLSLALLFAPQAVIARRRTGWRASTHLKDAAAGAAFLARTAPPLLRAAFALLLAGAC